jgi:hypothetical protein
MALGVVDEPGAARERAQALVALGVRRGNRRDQDQQDRGEDAADDYPSTLA